MERNKGGRLIELRKINNKKGITLVALVVTIVVLLILAGVSINILIGQNRHIKQSDGSKRKKSR